MRKFVALAVAFLVKLVVLHSSRTIRSSRPTRGWTRPRISISRLALAAIHCWLPACISFPLYIYFLSAILGVARSLIAVRLIQALLGTTAVGFIFVAAREWFGVRAAWIAATLAALTGLFTFYEALVLQAALDPVLTAAALAALSLGLNRRVVGWVCLSGLAFGLQALNRPNILLAAAGLAALMLVGLRPRKVAAAFTASLVLALAPLMIRNAIVADDWFPSSSHGGLNFYIGNNSQADGTYHAVPGVTRTSPGSRPTPDVSPSRRLEGR